MNIPDKTIPLPEPWYWTDQNFNNQLSSETSRKHILFNKKVRTLARRQDKDDVLYEIIDTTDYQYAVVHLTWSKTSHPLGDFPKTILYKNWQDLYENRILSDAEDFK